MVDSHNDGYCVAGEVSGSGGASWMALKYRAQEGFILYFRRR